MKKVFQAIIFTFVVTFLSTLSVQAQEKAVNEVKTEKVAATPEKTATPSGAQDASEPAKKACCKDKGESCKKGDAKDGKACCKKDSGKTCDKPHDGKKCEKDCKKACCADKKKEDSHEGHQHN